MNRSYSKLRHIQEANVLLENRTNNKPINEIFGLSKEEKKQKELKQEVQKAKQEVDDLDLSSLFRETNDNTDDETYEKLANIITKNLKNKMPTFLKLFPQILDDNKNKNSNAIRASYEHNGKRLKGITLSTLGSFLMQNYGDSMSKEIMKKRLNKLIDK